MRRFRTKRNGFTLVELIVVLAISALLAGLAIPSAIPWYQSQKALEREANAQTLYTTAQHNIVSLKSQGALGDYQGGYRTATQASTDNSGSENLNRTTLASEIAAAGDAVAPAKNPAGDAGSADWDANLVVLDSAQSDANAQAALSALVPNASTLLSNSTFSGPFANPGRYFVILNARTGYIYGAFYSEDASLDYDDLYAHQDDANWLTAHQAAFYGGVTQLPIGAEEQEAQTYVGYFELDDANNVTGLYGYKIDASSDGSASTANVTDCSFLWDNNAISSTCYGILTNDPDLAAKLNDTDLDLHDPRTVTPRDGQEGLPESMTLYVYSGNSDAWTPVRTWTDADSNPLTFSVNQNFAAEINLNAGGTTTSSATTHQVRTVEQLEHIGAPINGADASAYLGSDQTFFQTHDITISGAWQPIGLVSTDGSVNRPFKGTLIGAFAETDTARAQSGLTNADGSSYGCSTPTMEELKTAERTLATDASNAVFQPRIYLASGADFQAGLAEAQIQDWAPATGTGIFGTVEGGTIKHATVSAEGSVGLSTTSSITAGLLVGKASNANIESCAVDLSAQQAASWNTARIARSIDLDVSRPWGNGVLAVGGLVGSADTVTFADDRVALAASDSTAISSLSLSASNTSRNFAVNAGGLVGYAHASTFDRSGNVANGVSATGTADNAEATALSVTANGGTSAAAGAFCGSFDASSIDDSKPTAASADAASAVTSTGATVTVTATNAASTYAGGFAGSATGSSTIKDAFQTATPVAASDNGGAFTVNAQGPGWGTSWAGGLIGYLNASTVSAVSPSLAAQTAVTANDKTAYAGGLIGQAEKSSVTGLNGAIAGDSFNVSATSTDGGGKAWAGGLIGSLANASTFGGSNAVFKAQTASITANAPAAAYAGGLAGQTDNSALSSSNLAFGSGAFSVNAAADAGWGRGWAGGAIGQANSSSVTSLTQTVDGTSGNAALSVDATGNSSRAGGFAGDITGTRNGIGLAYDTLALSSGAHQATLTVGSADTLHAAGFAGWLSGTSMAHCALSSDNVTTGASKVVLNQRTYSPAAGMVAVGERSTIGSSFVEANIASQTASGIGFFFGSDQSDRGTTISNCAAIGIVSGDNAYGFTVDQAKDQSRGGILAYAPSKISNSYAAVKKNSDATDAQLAAFCEMDAGRWGAAAPPANLSNCATAGTKNTDLGSSWSGTTGRLSSFTYRSATNGTLATELGSAFHDTVTTSSRGPFPVATTTAKGTAVSPADYIGSWQDDERASELQEQVLDQMITIANAHQDAAREMDWRGRSVLRSSDFLSQSTTVGSLNWMKSQLRDAGTNANDPDALKIIDSLTAYQVEFGPRGESARYGGVWAQLGGTTYQLTDFENDGNGNLDGV
ncbi:MAG: prepilin-type N-terminal cleavage/methylation domain-containing protein [Denitrobacterium sp.]|nr:prepilin-type N-terminal cleavage/methylation domain-containing protein [Denitrobacterium sp.]